MALRFAANSYAQSLAAVATGRPLTLAGWFRADAGTTGYALTISDSNSNNFIGLLIRGSDQMAGAAERTAGAFATVSVGSYTPGTWQHAAAVFTGTNTRQGYVNGVAASAVSQSSAPTGLDRTLLRIRAGSPQNENGLLLAEIGAWNVALTASDIALLAAGLSPLALSTQRRHLVLYRPLHSSVNQSFIGPAFSVTGSATSEPHCRTLSHAAALASFGGATLALPWTRAAASHFVTGTHRGEVYAAGAARGVATI